MSKVSSIYVPDEGPTDASIMVVGEAPGEHEEDQRKPFVGTSGQFLERYLGRCGIRRDKIYLANLCHYRPAGNKFTNLLGTSELGAGLVELGKTIESVNPKFIISLGNWPMYFLTALGGKNAGTGISNYRGSVVPSVDDFIAHTAGRKVGITYHPAYVTRPEGFENHPVFHLDLQKFVANSRVEGFDYPEYQALVDPINSIKLAEEFRESEWLAVDIETFGSSMACIGFADSASRAMCLTFQNPLGWDLARAILSGPAKKIFQFGAFDIEYLRHYYKIPVANYIFDTYIAQANLLPGFPKSLQFLTSIYTNFPYYKDEGKTWKQNMDLRQLWGYNIKDCIATFIIAMKQMEELKELYGPLDFEEMKARAA